jgi:hypothetical protein
MRDVADPKPRLEATVLVEAMNAGVLAATLEEDVMAILVPGGAQRGVNNGTAMALTSKFRMNDDIFEEPVLTSRTQQIWRGDKHTGCNDLGVCDGHEDRNTVA